MRDILLPYIYIEPEENFPKNPIIKETTNPEHFKLHTGTISGFDMTSIKGYSKHLFGVGMAFGVGSPSNVESNLLEPKSYTDRFMEGGYSNIVEIGQYQKMYFGKDKNEPVFIKPTDIVPRHIVLEENEIAIVPIRELTYEDAKKEIIDYIKKVGRKVDTVEIVEELWLDIELAMQILEEIDESET